MESLILLGGCTIIGAVTIYDMEKAKREKRERKARARARAAENIRMNRY